MKNKFQSVALILCLEKNKTVALFEYECLLTVEVWRKRNHYLNNIDIYIYINKDNAPSNHTIKTLRTYSNIKFIIYDKTFKYKFLNTLYCLYHFEKYQSNNYTYSIYIDLDMFLLKPIPINFLNTEKTLLCYYTMNFFNDYDNSLKFRILNNNKYGTYSYNTYLIINYLKHRIFYLLYSLIDNINYISYFNTNILYNNDSNFFEEGIYDYAYKIGILNNSNCNFLDINTVSERSTSFFKHKHMYNIKDYILFRKELVYDIN